MNQTQVEHLIEIVMRSEATTSYKLELIDSIRHDYDGGILSDMNQTQIKQIIEIVMRSKDTNYKLKLELIDSLRLDYKEVLNE